MALTAPGKVCLGCGYASLSDVCATCSELKAMPLKFTSNSCRAANPTLRSPGTPSANGYARQVWIERGSQDENKVSNTSHNCKMLAEEASSSLGKLDGCVHVLARRSPNHSSSRGQPSHGVVVLQHTYRPTKSSRAPLGNLSQNRLQLPEDISTSQNCETPVSHPMRCDIFRTGNASQGGVVLHQAVGLFDLGDDSSPCLSDLSSPACNSDIFSPTCSHFFSPRSAGKMRWGSGGSGEVCSTASLTQSNYTEQGGAVSSDQIDPSAEKYTQLLLTGRACFKQRQYSMAAKKYNRAIANQPADAWGYICLGEVRYVTKRFKAALSMYLQASERAAPRSLVWGAAIASAFILLLRLDTVPRPSWWNDEDLLRLSQQVLEAGPNENSFLKMRGEVLGCGKWTCSKWEPGPRSPEQLHEAARCWERISEQAVASEHRVSAMRDAKNLLQAANSAARTASLARFESI